MPYCFHLITSSYFIIKETFSHFYIPLITIEKWVEYINIQSKYALWEWIYIWKDLKPQNENDNKERTKKKKIFLNNIFKLKIVLNNFVKVVYIIECKVVISQYMVSCYKVLFVNETNNNYESPQRSTEMSSNVQKALQVYSVWIHKHAKKQTLHQFGLIDM